MDSRSRHSKPLQRLRCRDLRNAGAAAGAMMSAGPLLAPRTIRAQPERGGILRAEQQYYFYRVGVAGSWPPSVKNCAPNPTCDYGGHAVALWLEK